VLRGIRLIDLVNTIDATLVAAAFGMNRGGVLPYVADHIDQRACRIRIREVSPSPGTGSRGQVRFHRGAVAGEDRRPPGAFIDQLAAVVGLGWGELAHGEVGGPNP
jgi:hypothetical protein